MFNKSPKLVSALEHELNSNWGRIKPRVYVKIGDELGLEGLLIRNETIFKIS